MALSWNPRKTECGADGSASVPHVIDKDDFPARDREIDFRAAVHGLFGNSGKIFAVRLTSREPIGIGTFSIFQISRRGEALGERLAG